MRTTAKRVIQFGLETTYGTDPVLDGTNGILCQNVSLTPFAGSLAKRQMAHGTFGADADAPVGLYRTLAFDVELAGSGVAGTPPLYGPILRACGMSETITDTVKVEYAPISASQESGAAYFVQDGKLHKMLGSRGSVVLKLTGGALPMISFALSGLCTAADTDAAAATGIETALANFIQPVEVNKLNTTTCTLQGYAGVLESLTLDQGNSVVFRDRPNAAYVALTDRVASGTLVMEDPTFAAKNYFTAMKARTLGALAVVHGTVGGNIIQIDAPKVQVGLPGYSDLNGVVGLSLPLGYKRTVGDDEFKLTVK